MPLCAFAPEAFIPNSLYWLNLIRLGTCIRCTQGQINDPYFYGEICRTTVSQSSDICYTICQTKEIPCNTGGKPALIV